MTAETHKQDILTVLHYFSHLWHLFYWKHINNGAFKVPACLMGHGKSRHAVSRNHSHFFIHCGLNYTLLPFCALVSGTWGSWQTFKPIWGIVGRYLLAQEKFCYPTPHFRIFAESALLSNKLSFMISGFNLWHALAITTSETSKRVTSFSLEGHFLQIHLISLVSPNLRHFRPSMTLNVLLGPLKHLWTTSLICLCVISTAYSTLLPSIWSYFSKSFLYPHLKNSEKTSKNCECPRHAHRS